ncbi:hypothetical protein FH972_018282 [Carpinus fangiana]|uniref:Uncharacterized protein n=1 Tax=Carpinus fangiana TaxID=176857 RepID=A0A5N6RNQ2_9ROSI|nr:hypothetical protein FH972_018282 [Carpinus fangiana]
MSSSVALYCLQPTVCYRPWCLPPYLATIHLWVGQWEVGLSNGQWWARAEVARDGGGSLDMAASGSLGQMMASGGLSYVVVGD